ncbi:hypothetical protein AVEN_203898-1 [Araneus ventricosus]|uniref:Integrase p58-like C-terminal domain-containing protein n=1 Tax=Araneus ventricosus TaxID=182803 RepID=A0A4Y2T0V0_ARAVE|nr:hypothetical protein AVEN_203898-1 [Araneus ventricosus]
MLFGRTRRLPCDILVGRSSDTPSSQSEYLNNLEARLKSVHAFARERIKLASERMKTRYDSGATGHHFKEGDQVWMYNPKRRRGLSPKLQQNWEGPYTIVKKLNDVIYRVQRSPNAKPKPLDLKDIKKLSTDQQDLYRICLSIKDGSCSSSVTCTMADPRKLFVTVIHWHSMSISESHNTREVCNAGLCSNVV